MMGSAREAGAVRSADIIRIEKIGLVKNGEGLNQESDKAELTGNISAKKLV